jgi:Zn-dependent protease
MLGSFFNPPFIIAVLIAISVHESAHAWMAWKLGDATAAVQGRITLNPLAHLDPLGALMFLLVGFGWAKPVPVNPFVFRRRKLDNALVALAGPASNLLLGILCFLALLLLLRGHAISPTPWGLLGVGENLDILSLILAQVLAGSVFVNFGLMAFNLIPIAPLDGSHILQMFIPYEYEERYEAFMRMGPMLLIGLIVAESILNVSLISAWVYGIMDIILRILLTISASLF